MKSSMGRGDFKPQVIKEIKRGNNQVVVLLNNVCPYCGKVMQPCPSLGINWYKCSCGGTQLVNPVKGKRKIK